LSNFDVFISHASEDKEEFVRQLAGALTEKGLQVWYDEFTLKLGDSLRKSIDKGLSSCDYGVVILSLAFFKKDWPQKELDALSQREAVDQKVILQVWHNISKNDIVQYSPLMADRVAVKSSEGLERVVDRILEVVRPDLRKNYARKNEGAGLTPGPEELLTRDTLLRYARTKSTKIDWEVNISSVYQTSRVLNILNIAQFAEAIDDEGSRKHLNDIYQRLLGREPDWAGILFYQPWLYLQEAKGRELVEQNVLSSPEYRMKHGYEK